MSREKAPLPTNTAARAPRPLVTNDIAGFAARLPPGSRLIGVDVGTRTLGLALSDVGRMIASALETIARSRLKADAARIVRHASAHGVGGLVVGLPLNLDGTQGPRAQAARAFARSIADATGLPVLLWDERLSTAEAERMLIAADTTRKRRSEVIDKLAATLILQGALDRLRGASSRKPPPGA